jgi:hypothetical protein
MRVEYPGAIYHVMDRGDRREDIFLDDVDRQDFLKTPAEACQKTGWQVHAYCLKEEMSRLKSREGDLASRPKNEPGKLVIAARLRRETTLPIKWIAARVQLGTSKSANASLHNWMRTHGSVAIGQLQPQPMADPFFMFCFPHK